jgi:hypothetical protein
MEAGCDYDRNLIIIRATIAMDSRSIKPAMCAIPGIID